MASIPLRWIPKATLVVIIISLSCHHVTSRETTCRTSQSTGREFIVGFLQTSHLESAKELHIAATTRARVNITAPEVFRSVPYELELTGSTFTVVSLKGMQDACSTAVLIQSTSDISVVGLVTGNNTGAFLALPTEALGNEYFVVSYPVPTRLSSTKRGSEFIIIGTTDRTNVFIRFAGSPRYNGVRYAAGSSITITVNRLEIKRFVSRSGDLTGTHVISDHPVVVTSGNKCADVPLNTRFCDHIIEQVPPFQFWGSHFVTTPLASRRAGDIFRIVAGRNRTSVKICGSRQRTMRAGQFIERSMHSNLSCAIESSKPILVLQYSKGGSADKTTADPSMMLVPALEQYVTEAWFSVPDISSKMTTVSSYINVVLQCELIPFINQSISTSYFQGDGSFNASVAGRTMCSTQIPLRGGGNYLIQFQGIQGAMSLVLYGNGMGDHSTSFGLPVGFIFKDNSCFNLTKNFLTVPALLTNTPLMSTLRPGWGAVNEPGNVGNGINGNQEIDHNNLLAISLIIFIVSLMIVTILVGYVVILRKRVEVLETERRQYSHLPAPHGPDGYIGLDGSQIEHREYMTLTNSDEPWHLNRRSDRSPFRGVQTAQSVRNSSSSIPRHAGSRPQSANSRSTSRNFDRDTAELLSRHSSSRDTPDHMRISSQSDSFGNVNPSFCDVDSVYSAQDTISEISFQPHSLRTPTRPVRRHHSGVERFSTTTPVPKPRHHGPRALRRSASTPEGNMFDTSVKVHYHVPRGDPVLAYDRPRHRTCSEGLSSPSAADILRPPEEVSNRSSRESSSNESEASMPIPQDDGYMSMKEARASTASKSSQSTLGGGPIKEIEEDQLYPEENVNRKEQFDEDSTEYTELF